MQFPRRQGHLCFRSRQARQPGKAFQLQLAEAEPCLEQRPLGAACQRQVALRLHALDAEIRPRECRPRGPAFKGAGCRKAQGRRIGGHLKAAPAGQIEKIGAFSLHPPGKRNALRELGLSGEGEAQAAHLGGDVGGRSCPGQPRRITDEGGNLHPVFLP